MSGNLPKNRSLLVISDTSLCIEDGKVFGFGPVVIELEALLELFDQISWIGFQNCSKDIRPSLIQVPSNRITPILFKHVGGRNLSSKFSVMASYPSLKRLLKSEIAKHDYIHCRAPSHPSFIASLLVPKFPGKKFWIKYAGNWVGPASWFYRYQRERLKVFHNNLIVTVNGNWEGNGKHIVSFENPCLSEQDRNSGKIFLDRRKKNGAPLDFCFVGGLNFNKGILLLLKAWIKTNNPKKGILHIVGEGPLKSELMHMVGNSEKSVKIHGAMPKNKVNEIYTKCNFLVLPSKSEGFPKVIGEAMNFGCIPIVSDVSCIGQYIQTDIHGILLSEVSVEKIQEGLEKAMSFSEDQIEEMSVRNFEFSNIFTYQHYLERVKRDIFPNQLNT